MSGRRRREEGRLREKGRKEGKEGNRGCKEAGSVSPPLPSPSPLYALWLYEEMQDDNKGKTASLPLLPTPPLPSGAAVTQEGLNALSLDV